MDICFLCIRAASKNGTYIEAASRFLDRNELLLDQKLIPEISSPQRYNYQYHDWYPRSKGYDYGLNVSNYCAGDPIRFVSLVRQLDTRTASTRWFIDNGEVTPLDCTSMFGMPVCPSHVDNAWDLWNGKYKR